MIIKGLFSFYFFLLLQSVQAQSPLGFLKDLHTHQPIQKVYIQTDRENYVAGQTIWLKAYLSTDYLPDTISTTLQASLIDIGTNKVVKQIAMPVFFGSATGSIDVPDSLNTGYYMLRSLTNEMQKVNNEFAYAQNIFVFGKTSKENLSASNKAIIDFFPEGGNMVAGLSTTIAFKAYKESGLPTNISGAVFNSKKEKISELITLHDGMGMFDFTPQSGENYYAVIEGIADKHPLPPVLEKGVILTLIPHPQGSFFEIKQNKGDENFAAAYMIGQMQHQLVFKKDFPANGAGLEGVINTIGLRSGIMQVTVFNKNHMPLAERLCFINNKEYLQSVSLITDTLNFSAGARNRFSVLLEDTVQGQLSIAVTDPALDMKLHRSQNIISSLLLTSDIKGFVHNPAWYFSSEDDSVKTAIDLVMMTNGWRRFSWKTIGNISPAKKSEPYITIKGNAFLQGTKNPFAEKQLLLMITNLTNKKARSTHILETDKAGAFRLDSLVFFDRNRLLFSDIRGKKSQYIDVELKNDSLLASVNLPLLTKLKMLSTDITSFANWKMEYDAIQKAAGVMLDEVKLQATKKQPLQVVDETYTTGIFSGDATKAIDLVNSDEASTYMNIFDYLQSRVNGLTIVNDGLDYGLFYRQGPSISSMGNIPMTIFLDEIETDVSVVAAIHASQIALVKVYSSFVGGSGNSPGGAMAIYTKKGEDYVSNTSFANLKTFNGYTVTKEFFAPNYKLSTEGLSTDYRTTLDWRPSVFLNNVNAKVPFGFYNNNRTQSFKVVVEGMTTSGKLIWLEKIISK